jgi:hypothetical protein
MRRPALLSMPVNSAKQGRRSTSLCSVAARVPAPIAEKRAIELEIGRSAEGLRKGAVRPARALVTHQDAE